MEKFKSVSDAELLQKIEAIASEERRLSRELLEHLAEVDRRRLFLALGFPSLFAYVTVHLRYSESAAHRRISAARLMRDVPELADKVETGELSLTVVAQAQSVFREAGKSGKVAAVKKVEMLKALEGCSSREAERRLAAEFPQVSAQREVVRWTGPTEARLHIVLTSEQAALLEQVRARVGNPALTWAEAFERAAKFYLEKTDPARRVRGERAQSPTEDRSQNALPAPEVEVTEELPAEVLTPDTRYIEAAVRREVWRRDGAQCTYRSQITGRVCGSCVGLELDHLNPWALGGSNEADNLTLRCRAHNRWVGMKASRTTSGAGSAVWHWPERVRTSSSKSGAVTRR